MLQMLGDQLGKRWRKEIAVPIGAVDDEAAAMPR